MQKKWIGYAAAALMLTGCAAAETPAETETATAETSEPSATADAPETSEPTETAAAYTVEEICAAYTVTADGEFAPVFQQIADVYLGTINTEDGVREVHATLLEYEASADGNLLTALQTAGEPVHYMVQQLDAGNYQFETTWDAGNASLAVMQACADEGYTL